MWALELEPARFMGWVGPCKQSTRAWPKQAPGQPVAHPRFPLKRSFKGDIDIWVYDNFPAVNELALTALVTRLKVCVRKVRALCYGSGASLIHPFGKR